MHIGTIHLHQVTRSWLLQEPTEPSCNRMTFQSRVSSEEDGSLLAPASLISGLEEHLQFRIHSPVLSGVQSTGCGLSPLHK